MSKINVLILGSEGAIGSHMVKVLPSYLIDCNIIRVSRTNILASSDSASHTILVGDLLDIDFVKSVFKNHAVNVIIFCAAKWNGINQDPTVIDVNVTMFNNVLSSMHKSVSNFIFLSSSAVYSQNSFSDSALTELLPKSTYGQSKLINEVLLSNKAKQNNMSTCIYRPFHVVSPYENYCPGRSHITTDFVHRYIDLNIDFSWDTLSPDVFIPFFWVDDLCTLIADNIFNESFVDKIFNIGASKSYSVLDLALCVANIASKYGLSNKELPVIKEIFEPVENGMESGLIEIVGSVKERSLLEIVEKFICQKYGVIYEH